MRTSEENKDHFEGVSLRGGVPKCPHHTAAPHILARFTNIQTLTHKALVQEIDFDLNLLVKKVTKKSVVFRKATKEIGKI